MGKHYKCPFCDEYLRVDPCVNGGFAMGCMCAFQGPERPTKRLARKAVVLWLDSIDQLQAVVDKLSEAPGGE